MKLSTLNRILKPYYCIKNKLKSLSCVIENYWPIFMLSILILGALIIGTFYQIKREGNIFRTNKIQDINAKRHI